MICSLEKLILENIFLGKSVYIKKSPVAGLGAFAGEPIKKNEFVVEYTGELISHDESEKRGHVYDERDHTYLFNLNEGIYEVYLKIQ